MTTVTRPGLVVRGVKRVLRILTWPFRFLALVGRVERIERQLFVKAHVDRSARPTRSVEGVDYAFFARMFHAPGDIMREHFRWYVPLLRGRRTILDIGCGRGEFLDALREAGLSGTGVELDEGQASECRARGHTVVIADLFAHLPAVPDGSLDAVFSAQLVEHLPFAKVQELFGLVHRKLASGGLFIAETVNPHCLVGLKLFHLDPTHVTVLPPELLEFVGKSAGFADVRTVYPNVWRGEREPYFEHSQYAGVFEKT